MLETVQKQEGFWYNPNQPSARRLPKPVANDDAWEGQQEFIDDLLRIQEKEAHVISYRGMSMCRICGKVNGSQEYDYKQWVWPEGFRHYIEEHNVIPSDEFRLFVAEESKQYKE